MRTGFVARKHDSEPGVRMIRIGLHCVAGVGVGVGFMPGSSHTASWVKWIGLNAAGRLGATRNRSPAGRVTLNPDRDSVAAAHSLALHQKSAATRMTRQLARCTPEPPAMPHIDTLNLSPQPGRRQGLRMDLGHAKCSALRDTIAPRIASLARNSGQLRSET